MELRVSVGHSTCTTGRSNDKNAAVTVPSEFSLLLEWVRKYHV